MKIFWACLLTAVLWSFVSQGAVWPDDPWVNGAPRRSAVVSAVAFVSATDLQFLRMMHIWKKLEKKYGPLNVDFVIVAMQEPLFPFSQEMVESAVKEMNYALPVFVDVGNHYSKLWRAYVSPTVNLVLQDSKVTSFDPGNFDPFVFEKALQKLLKESGVNTLPPREYPNDVDLKDCHPRTLLVGTKFQKAWASTTPSFDGPWNLDSFWAQKIGDQTKPAMAKPAMAKLAAAAQMDLQITKSGLGIIAESKHPARVNVLIDGQRVPSELRGKDIQEDRTGATFINVSLPRAYEVLTHGGRAKENPVKVTFSVETSGFKVWALQVIPACMDAAL